MPRTATGDGSARSVHSRGTANVPWEVPWRISVSTPSDSPELEDREPLAPKRMERMGDFRRSRKGAAVRCSYR